MVVEDEQYDGEVDESESKMESLRHRNETADVSMFMRKLRKTVRAFDSFRLLKKDSAAAAAAAASKSSSAINSTSSASASSTGNSSSAATDLDKINEAKEKTSIVAKYCSVHN